MRLQKRTHGTLDEKASRHGLRMEKVRPSGVMVVEGSNAAKREEQAKNVAYCPFPILDSRLHPRRFFQAATKACRKCRSRKSGSKMVLCAVCHGWLSHLVPRSTFIASSIGEMEVQVL